MGNGKGDKERPKNRELWEKNYERIFQKKHGRKTKGPKKKSGSL